MKKKRIVFGAAVLFLTINHLGAAWAPMYPSGPAHLIKPVELSELRNTTPFRSDQSLHRIPLQPSSLSQELEMLRFISTQA